MINGLLRTIYGWGFLVKSTVREKIEAGAMYIVFCLGCLTSNL